MFVSALDKPHDGAAVHTPSDERARNSLRFLRHVEGVEFAGKARNWDAKRCFVMRVTVKDDEVLPDDGSAGLEVVRPTAPFQIERTPKELRQLEKTVRQWSEKHAMGDECAFCRHFARPLAEKSRGGLFAFLSSSVKDKSEAQWQSWLNASIESVRRADPAALATCEAVRHVPSVLARFLLQQFASDVVF